LSIQVSVKPAVGVGVYRNYVSSATIRCKEAVLDKDNKNLSVLSENASRRWIIRFKT
jgi:hypothetical protein